MPDLQWQTINDFSPGIHQVVSPNRAPGTAQADGTYRCYSRDGGALAPLPRVVEYLYPPSSGTFGHDTTDLVNEQFRIAGTHCVGPIFWWPDAKVGQDQNNNEFWMATEYWVEGGANDAQYIRVLKYRHNRANPDWVSIWDQNRTIEPYNEHKVPAAAEFVTTRSNHSDPDVMGAVVVCFCFYGWMQQYPDETDPAVDGTVALPGDTSLSGGLISCVNIVAHQGRVVGFPLTVVNAGDEALHVGNENFFWSSVNDVRTLDPSLSGKLYWVNAGWESPTGYQVQASLTADELFLIKSKGGGLVLRGSLNDFTAINYPYVKSTGYSINKGTVTPLGYAYPVEASGVWVWGGGELSEHVTKQMEPGFWEPPVTLPDGATSAEIDFLRWPTSCADWGSLALFPNNYVWDTDFGGWWRIEQPETIVLHRWVTDWRNKLAYGSPSGWRNFDEPCAYVFDRENPTNSYGWHSHPIAGTLDRDVELRELIVVASGQGTVTLRAYTAADPAGQSQTFPVSGTDSAPSVVRRPLHVKGPHLTFQVTAEAADDSDGAPIIHEIRWAAYESTLIPREV